MFSPVDDDIEKGECPITYHAVLLDDGAHIDDIPGGSP